MKNANNTIARSVASDVQESGGRIYQTKKNKGGISWLLKSRGILVYDEESQRTREMRYCPAEKSIWADEQSDAAVVQPILFQNKRLMVPASNKNLIEILDRHPSNVANGGVEFSELNPKKEAEKDLEKKFALNDAITLIKNKDYTDLLAVAIHFRVNPNASSQEIKSNLITIAERDPDKFLEAFDDEVVQMRALVHQAKKFRIIGEKPQGYYWEDTGKIIVTCPEGQSAEAITARFLLTPGGASARQLLEEQMDQMK